MGCLYIVPTPIGNLQDITLRALSVLRDVPVVLAEDTRHTRKLLTHHGIRARLVSYHAHNEGLRTETLLELLNVGDVALVSDAGMPTVSDPGGQAVRAAVAAGLPVEVLPGPCAAVTAWVAAGLESEGFLFLGFLPRRKAERRVALQRVASVPFALVMYEAPHRLGAALEDMLSVFGNRPAAAARELTKLHEEVTRGSIQTVIERFAQDPPRGELTVVVAGMQETVERDKEGALSEVRRRHTAGESGRGAVAAVMAQFDMPRNEVYRMWVAQLDAYKSE